MSGDKTVVSFIPQMLFDAVSQDILKQPYYKGE
jgi:hypothetical protein